MKHLHFISASLLLTLVAFSGCSSPKDAATREPAQSIDEAGSHAHGPGPSGGVVFSLGRHHAEFTVDHPKQQCTIVMLGDDLKTPTAIAATGFVININESKTAEGTVVAPMTITMQSEDATDGKAAKFVGTDPGIANVADFAGTVSGEIDGKPALGEFKE